jgi:hypothetical protein
VGFRSIRTTFSAGFALQLSEESWQFMSPDRSTLGKLQLKPILAVLMPAWFIYFVAKISVTFGSPAEFLLRGFCPKFPSV